MCDFHLHYRVALSASHIYTSRDKICDNIFLLIHIPFYIIASPNYNSPMVCAHRYLDRFELGVASSVTFVRNKNY